MRKTGNERPILTYGRQCRILFVLFLRSVSDFKIPGDTFFRGFPLKVTNLNIYVNFGVLEGELRDIYRDFPRFHFHAPN